MKIFNFLFVRNAKNLISMIIASIECETNVIACYRANLKRISDRLTNVGIRVLRVCNFYDP